MSVLVVEVDSSESFPALLQQVKERTLEMIRYAGLPFDVIARELKLPHDLWRVPLNLCVNYLSSIRTSETVDGACFAPIRYLKDSVSHNLGLFVEQVDGALACALSYRSNYVTEDQALTLKETIISVLRQVTEGGGALEMLFEKEGLEELPDFNW